MNQKPGWARCISTGLDASVGASGPHDFAVRACSAKALAGPRPYPASFVEDSFAAPFVRAPDDRSRSSIRPAIPCAPDAVASIASRRAFVTCARPSFGRDGRLSKVDLPDVLSEMFLFRGLDFHFG